MLKASDISLSILSLSMGQGPLKATINFLSIHSKPNFDFFIKSAQFESIKHRPNIALNIFYLLYLREMFQILFKWAKLGLFLFIF